MYKYYFKKSCNYIFEIIKLCNYIFEIIKLYLYHIYVGTCTNIITLQYELDIYILGSNTAWRGSGSCSETLPYSKFRHIFSGKDDDEHRGLSVVICYLIVINKSSVKDTVCIW